MSARTKLEDRYELHEIVGQGEVGVVYRAYDRLMNRNVALTTVPGVSGAATYDLFFRDWSLQATLSHPNVAEVFDIGEFEQDGETQPFFATALLTGRTLEEICRLLNGPLPVAQAIGVICDVAGGLQAAHELGLVHGAVTEADIFVLEDDSAKVTGFGLVNGRGLAENPPAEADPTRLSPEQLRGDGPSPLSDVYSLAAVAYRALGGRQLFEAQNASGLREAVLLRAPEPLDKINPDVGRLVARVIQKALSKQPWHRFSDMREFSICLGKALRNEEIPFFDPVRVKPRIDRAQKAFERRQYEFASEILLDLESEGHLDTEITLLRRNLDRAVKQTEMSPLLETAAALRHGGDDAAALSKLDEALRLSPSDEEALSLKAEIEEAGAAFAGDSTAQTVQPVESEAAQTERPEPLFELDQQEREEDTRIRERRTELYERALEHWENGELTASLGCTEDLLALEEERPSAAGAESYRELYDRVRSERDSVEATYEKAGHLRVAGEFEEARELCLGLLNRRPDHPRFLTLASELDEEIERRRDTFVAETERWAELEPDLSHRLRILDEALERYPGEGRLDVARQAVVEQIELVESLHAAAQSFEKQGDYEKALEQWRRIDSAHPSYRGSAEEIGRIEQAMASSASDVARQNWIDEIGLCLDSQDFERAIEACNSALNEYPDDPDLIDHARRARKGSAQVQEVQHLLDAGREQCEQGQTSQGISLLRRAHRSAPANSSVGSVLAKALLDSAREAIDHDRERAARLLEELDAVDPTHLGAAQLRERLATPPEPEQEAPTEPDVNQAPQSPPESLVPQESREETNGRGLHGLASEVDDLSGDHTPIPSLSESAPKLSEGVRKLERVHNMMAFGVEPRQAEMLRWRVRSIVQGHASDSQAVELAASIEAELSQAVGSPIPPDPSVAVQETAPAERPVEPVPALAPDPSTDDPARSQEKPIDLRAPAEPVAFPFDLPRDTDPGYGVTERREPVPAIPPEMYPETPVSAPETDAVAGPRAPNLETPTAEKPLSPSLESAYVEEPPEPTFDSAHATDAAGGALSTPAPPKAQPPTESVGTDEYGEVEWSYNTPEPAVPRPAIESSDSGEPPPEAIDVVDEPEPAQVVAADAESGRPKTAPALPASARVSAAAAPLVAALSRFPRRYVVAASGSALALVVLIAVGISALRSGPVEEPAVGPVVFKTFLQAAPGGASLTIDGELCGTSFCEVPLEAGSHRLDARLKGYRTASASFELQPDGPPDPSPVVLILQPWPISFEITSDLASGKISLDGQEAGELEDGSFVLPDIEPGEHLVELRSGGLTASVPFEVELGAEPRILAGASARSLRFIAVTGLGAEASAWGGSEGDPVTLDGEDIGPMVADGMRLLGLSSGSHEVTVGSGRERVALSFEAGEEPAIRLFLRSDRNVGGLRISTNEDEVSVYINGTLYRRKTRRGAVTIYLVPRSYAIRVEKDGFISPPEQTASIKKGERTVLNFELQPSPRISSLVVKNGTPGAEVLLDGELLGLVGSDGRFRAPSLSPGKRKVLVRMRDHETKTWDKDFAAGETLEIDGRLAAVTGTLRIELTPPEADVSMTLRREGEQRDRNITDRSLTLTEGVYTVTATAEGFQDYAATLRVEPNAVRTARIVLARKAVPKRRRTLSLDDWVAKGDWRLQGKLAVRRGGGFVVAPRSGGAGSYQFTALLQAGRRLEWAVGFVDEKNYVLYQIDKKNFVRIPVVNGKKLDAVRVPHGVNRDEFLNVEVEVTAAGALIHRMFRTGAWQEVDSFAEAPNAVNGAFAFRIPSRDQVALTLFDFIAR